jgi:hypothetical protein
LNFLSFLRSEGEVTMRRLYLLLAIAVSLPFVIATAAHAAVILSAGVDSANNRLVIEGVNFGPGPIVTLGTAPLNVQSATATKIITDLPTSGFLPGSYVLKVQFSNSTIGLFVLSVGAVTTASTGGCGTNAPIVAVNFASAGGVGFQVTLLATVSDPDLITCGAREFFTYDWKFLDVPAGSRLTNLIPPFAQTPTFIPDVTGIYSVMVTVTDSTGRTARAFVSIPIAP